MIRGLEIENPYRYRAYFVGRKPMYYIQRDEYIAPDYPEVASIDENLDGPHADYTVVFINGRSLNVRMETPGTIVHYS